MEDDACNYKLKAPHGCVAHLCALCREPIALDPGVYTAAQIDQRIADHHPVCPARPIEVGDPIEWRRDDWLVVGDLVAHPWRPGGKAICLSRECHGMPKGRVFTIAPEHEAHIRRIPRPEQSRGGQQDPVSAAPRDPVLIGGLTPDQCLSHWMENRLFIEGLHFMATLPNALTPEQVAVGRALWLARFGAQRSAELRAKVTASREADAARKPSVSIMPELDPCD